MKDLLVIIIPSFCSLISVVTVAIINSHGARAKNMEKLKSDIEELKTDYKVMQALQYEQIRVLNSAYNEFREKGKINGKTQQAVEHMQEKVTQVALN